MRHDKPNNKESLRSIVAKYEGLYDRFTGVAQAVPLSEFEMKMFQAFEKKLAKTKYKFSARRPRIFKEVVTRDSQVSA